MGMIKITVILPARGQIDKFERMMASFVRTTRTPNDVEILIAIDDDDPVFMSQSSELEEKYHNFNLRFIICKPSEHFTKDYWNVLARLAKGRWIFPIACDHEVITPKWDRILVQEMERRAESIGDDIIHGLIKDNIKRTNEDPLYPNFSCHPVQSKEHVEVMGYFFDERYWAWGPDQAVSWLYRALCKLTGENRLVSLMGVEIVTHDSIHTTTETDPDKLEEMRRNDKNFQKFCRIEREHPCTLTTEDYLNEALKLREYIKEKRRIK
jgi:hypothetical protein